MFPRKNRVLRWAGVTQLVECDLAKVDVAGSNPVSRSIFRYFRSPPIAMKRLIFLPLIWAVFAFSALAQDYKLEPLTTAAPGLPDSYAKAIQTQGVRVVGGSEAWCEVWL